MKEKENKADSSSSEDEIPMDVLKEAIDPQFLSNSLYNTEKTTIPSQHEGSKTNVPCMKSLRTNSRTKDEFTNFGVTAGFQSFVAKKLDEILEKTIELKHNEVADDCAKQQERKNEDSGIKLLSSSEDFLVTSEVITQCEEISKKRKKRRMSIEEDNDAMSKFREAAISPERILNKLDTKAWTSKHSEPEFKYKRLKNGTLVELK